MNRRELLLVLGAVGFTPGLALAQPKKTWRIGYLGTTSLPGFARRVEAFRAGLRELGYVEGKNIAIEFRWAEGKYERLPVLAAELVRLEVDLIVTAGTAGILAARKATATIPIVMASSGDVISLGVVPSLARPGGNLTGVTGFGPEATAKRLELLVAALPRIRQVAFLENPDNPVGAGPTNRAMEATAASLKLELQRFPVRGPDELDGAFAAMAKRRIDAVVLGDDGVLVSHFGAIAKLAAKMRIPSIGLSEFAEAGGLMAYGSNRIEMFRRAATYVDKILKGAKPGDLPIEQPTKFELVVNLKTAKILGLTIPQPFLMRADRVIE